MDSRDDSEPKLLPQQDMTLFFMVTFLAFIGTFTDSIVKETAKLWYRPCSRENHIISEVTDLKMELTKISMVDEFAKHAKIQRRINKLTIELETLQKDRNWSHLKVSWGLRMVIWVSQTIFLIVINFQYRYMPVIMLPKEMLQPYYPFGFLLAFPHGIEGEFILWK
jgi:hypothetical protein